jgi:glycosyltransferase involved in cell wall biosynthesis
LLVPVAVGWIILTLRAAAGMLGLPRLDSVACRKDEQLPFVSVLFSARDEADKLFDALRSQLSQDYPRYEVVAVDDRSLDATPQILDEFARGCKFLKVIHVQELPAGWLGKPHGLARAHEQASGEWLVFTDADVRFTPQALRQAVSLALDSNLDHLTLLARVDQPGVWEKIALTYFQVMFVIGVQPWEVSNPNSRYYAGVGAFQLIRRSAYEAIGTHRRLAMEVVDDMKLGKLVKQMGFRSAVAMPADSVRLRWHSGVGNLILGTTKNFFAAAEFRTWLVLVQIVSLLLGSVLPFVAAFLTAGLPQILAAIAVVCALVIQAGAALDSRASPLYALSHPLGALIFCYMLARSMVVTLWQGGIVWRDTFYPLDELRRGVV